MAEDFSVQVGRIIDRAKRRVEQAFKATAEDSVARVKELTPVDTGWLRSNWTAVRNDEALPKEGAGAMQAEQAIDALRVGDRILVVNPVAYARRVEFGFVGQDSLGRYYNQQGRGMVQQTVTEVPQIARNAVNRVTGE